jgi:predicted HD phosphohydrolase
MDHNPEQQTDTALESNELETTAALAIDSDTIQLDENQNGHEDEDEDGDGTDDSDSEDGEDGEDDEDDEDDVDDVDDEDDEDDEDDVDDRDTDVIDQTKAVNENDVTAMDGTKMRDEHGGDELEASDEDAKDDENEDPHGEFDENGNRVTHNAIDPLDDEDDLDAANEDSPEPHESDDPTEMVWTVDHLLASLEQDVHQHGLQCAYELEQQFPEDRELQIAGLVHDVAHRISSEAMHGIVAADLIRPLYGDRVANLVELHVDAKRYLVTVDPAYHELLSPESVHTLMLQGSTMASAEQQAFENNPHFGDAVALRRADDAAKVPGRSVPDLSYWEPILRSAALIAA